MAENEALNPLLAVALIFAAGYPAGLMARRLGVPSVTGNILAGVVLGPSVFHLFDHDVGHEMEPLTVFAMGLAAAVVGGHLSYRRLHNALRRVVSITMLEVPLTFGLVAGGSYLFGAEVQTSLLLGAIATETAPATVFAVIREARAKGMLVKTLMADVALNNVCCLVLFSLVLERLVYLADPAGSALIALAETLFRLGVAVGLGAAIAFALILMTRRLGLPEFTGVLITILLTAGGAQFFGASPLLACLAFGVTLGNLDRQAEDLISSLESLEPALLTCFFTLAGIELNLGQLPSMGLLGAVYFFARIAGKFGGGTVGAHLGSDVPRIQKNMGMALLPHAGLAIGLVVILRSDPRVPQEIGSAVTNIVLAAVVLSELIGPPFVRRAVERAGEKGKDRRRIIDFLQEEHILAPLQSKTKGEAIRELAGFLSRTHGLGGVTVDELVESIEEREKTLSTAMGLGVAIPHARVAVGPEIAGVMGISPEGIDFEAPDGGPVHVVVLIATPPEHQDRHLEVMAAVARMMSDPKVRAELSIATSPARAFDAIESDVNPSYNYFLDDDE